MKKTLALILAMAVLIMSFPVMSVVADDVAAGYTQITDAAGFLAIADNPSGSYMLMNDITLPDTYIPIAFSGKLIGADAEDLPVITVNVGAEDRYALPESPTNMDKYANSGWGLFSIITGAVQIKNIEVAGTVTGDAGEGSHTYGYTGGIAGQAVELSEGAIIENCVNSATITGGSSNHEGTGGIVGKDYSSGSVSLTIKDCVNAGTVTAATKNVGGIVGCSKATITACVNKGAVDSYNQVGGIVGDFNDGGIVELTYNTGAVKSQYYAAGIVGNVGGEYGSSTVTIKNCYADFEAYITQDLGGIVITKATNSTVNVENCYSYARSTNYPGNFFGPFGSQSGFSATNVYYYDWKTETTNAETGALSGADMKDLSKFTGFDSSIWTIDALSAYKYPQLIDNRQAYEYTEINTAADFEAIRENPSGSYKLMNDITLPDTYIPIAFSGKLIGADAENLPVITVNVGAEDRYALPESPTNMDKYANSGWGLFSIITGAVQIKNIEVAGTVTGDAGEGSHTYGYTGGIAGQAVELSEGAIIENCVNSATITGGSSNHEGTGGIVGKDYSSGSVSLTIKDCVNAGTVTAATKNVGGIVGCSKATITACVNKGAVDSYNQVGGIVGDFNDGGIVELTYNTGAVKSQYYAAGIVGNVGGEYGSSTVTIKNCYADFEAYITQDLGGIVITKATNSTVNVENCYSYARSTNYPGNFFGPFGSQSGFSVTNVYYYDWKTETTNAETGALSGADMKDLSKFTGFDSSIWTIDALSAYKYPQLIDNRQAYEYTEINTAADFEAIRENPSGSYKLMNDITLPDTYIPIAFSGKLIGADAENLPVITVNVGAEDRYALPESPTNMDKYANSGWGLFSIITGAVQIKNIEVAGTVTGDAGEGSHTYGYTGGIAGQAVELSEGAIIENCVNSATITGGSSNHEGTGGIIGKDYSSGTNVLTIKNCVNVGTVTAATKNVGGIVGCSKATITACVNKGAVEGRDQVGGIVGDFNDGGIVELTYNTGAVKSQFYAAGIVGKVGGEYGSSTVTIKNCYADFEAYITQDLGGIVITKATNSTVNVENCYSYARSTNYPGNFFGPFGSQSGFSATNVYYYDWKTETTNAETGALSGADMKDLSKFTGFDSSIWTIDALSAYKYPQFIDNRQAYANYNEITTVNDFKAISNDPTGVYKLMADIVLTDNYTIASFAGVLDGNGKTITITDGITAIFAETTATAEIYNLTIRGDVTLSATGAVLAIKNAGTISNCENYATLTADGEEIMDTGVFAGTNTGTITGCVNHADLEFSGVRCGGIAGENSGTISNCGNHGDIKQALDEAETGSIVGQHTGLVSDCYNTGNVSGGGDAGGIVGRMLYNNTTIENCYNAGNIVANSEEVAAGIVATIGHTGRNENNPYTGIAIINCYNAGAVMSGTTNKTEEWAIFGRILNNSANPAISGCAYLAAENTEGTDIQGLSKAVFDAEVAEYNITLCGSEEIAKPTLKLYDGEINLFSTDKISVEDKFKLLGKTVLLSFANVSFGKMGWALDEVGFEVLRTDDTGDYKTKEITSVNALGDFAIMTYGGYITEGSYSVRPYAKYSRVGEETVTFYGEAETINSRIANP